MSKNLYKVINSRGGHRNVQADYMQCNNKGVVTLYSDDLGVGDVVAVFNQPVQVCLANSCRNKKKDDK